MEQGPSWEANRFSASQPSQSANWASQETTRILCYPKAYYRVYKYPLLVLR
jgi:enterochelin esterase-like enzyme